MKKISILILLMIFLPSLILTGCQEFRITPEIDQGNSGDIGTTEVDTTKPVITGSRIPLPNSFGWNNTDVTVSFSCADTGLVQSGIDTNTVSGKTLTAEGKNQSVTNTGVCINVAGNTADPVTVSNINIDKTPPEVTITLPGTGEYILNQSITAAWSATDALSGIISPVSGTFSIDTSSVGTKTFTMPVGTAMDKAGNSSLKVTASYSVIEDPEDPEMIYPQQWATGDGTAENPWANDCIQKALDFVPAGGTIFLKAGYYILSDQAEITKKVNIIGEGRDKTIIITADAHGFYIESVDFVTIKNLTIDGDAQTDNKQYLAVISVNISSYASLENIEVKNGGYYGINMWQVNHSSFQNIHSHANYRTGVHAGADAIGWNMYNTYKDIYCWDNLVDGFNDRGSTVDPVKQLYNVYDNLHCWDNRGSGIDIGLQKSGVLSNSFANGNGKYGISSYDIEDFNIQDCSITLNALEGVFIVDSKNVNYTNIIVKNNNVSDTAGIPGIVVYSSDGTKFTSCQSYDDRVVPLQYWGLKTGSIGNVDFVEISDCTFMPNKSSAIYNHAGAVIKEAVLVRFYQD